MTRVDFKQGVLQGGSGKLEKWVACCQKSTGAGDIVLKRACSVFKRPHKTLTALPLFTLTPQSTKKYEIPGRRKPQPGFLSCVNPVTKMPYHIFVSHPTLCFAQISAFNKKRKKVVSFHHPISGFLLIPWLSLAANSFSFYPHQKPGQASLQHSRIARGEHLCLPERWHGAGLFEFHCDVYMESSVSTEQMHLAPSHQNLFLTLSPDFTSFSTSQGLIKEAVCTGQWSEVDLWEARHLLVNTAGTVEADLVNDPLRPSLSHVFMPPHDGDQNSYSGQCRFLFATPTCLK